MAATVIISAILAAVAAVIVIRIVKNSRNGHTSCGCGCSNCPYSKGCQQHNK